MILETILHSLKSVGVGVDETPICKQNACMMGVENYGVMLLKASLHGAKAGGGGIGVAQPPICKHTVPIRGSERLHMGSDCAG